MFILRYLVSLIVGLVLRVRHLLFDLGVLKSICFNTPTIVIGNLKVGGTGKTPMTEFLISELKGRYEIAILSRGYGRRTKGFVLATESSTSEDIGDEPLLIYRRHSNVVVAVCEKRVNGIREIRKLFPAVELIILDDAFQHRYVDASLDILLTEYDRPYYSDHLLPYGRLRDIRSQASRANMIVVTKSPANTNSESAKDIISRIKPKPYQSIFFSTMREGKPYHLFNRGYEEEIKSLLKGDNVILVSAIANPQHIIKSVEERFNLMATHIYKDHYSYKQSDVDKIIKDAVLNNAYIIITEKDATKISALKIPSEEKYRFYVAPISIELLELNSSINRENFITNIEKLLKQKNGKYHYNAK